MAILRASFADWARRSMSTTSTRRAAGPWGPPPGDTGLLAVLSGWLVRWRDAPAMDKPVLGDEEFIQGQSPATADAHGSVFDGLLHAANALRTICERLSGKRYHLLRFANMLGPGQDSITSRMDPLPVVEDSLIAVQEQRAAADAFRPGIHSTNLRLVTIRRRGGDPQGALPSNLFRGRRAKDGQADGEPVTAPRWRCSL